MFALILLAALSLINTSTILLATEKPFTKETVNDIKGIIEKSGNTFKLLEKYKTKQELLDAVKDVDAIIVRSDKITKEVMDASNNLKVVARAGAGFDNIDLAYASKKGIVVMNTPGQNANAVAELVFGLSVYAVRNFYNGSTGSELKDLVWRYIHMMLLFQKKFWKKKECMLLINKKIYLLIVI